MIYSSPDKRRVFLAYRPVFTGPQAKVWKSQKVREVIEQHRESFKPLIKDFGVDKVADIVKILLDQRIFESELKAKIAFPELFQTSTARDIQRNEAEGHALCSAAEALEELESARDGRGLGDREDDIIPEISESTVKTAPSLYPSYLPYATQHLILTTAQRQLEECCFDFAAKWLPSLLHDNKWDCAEAVELTEWTRALDKCRNELPPSAINKCSEAPLNEVFLSTNVIRHTAVHRLSTTARGVQKMIQSASRLAETLGDHPRASELKILHLEVGSRIRDMELNKNFLENRLDEKLQVISQHRADLDMREKEAVAIMLREDQENKQLISSFLEEAVKMTFGQSDKIEPMGSANIFLRLKMHPFLTLAFSDPGLAVINGLLEGASIINSHLKALSKPKVWRCPNLRELEFQGLMVNKGWELDSQHVVWPLTTSVIFLTVVGARLVYGDWGTAWKVGCFLVSLATLLRMWANHA